MTSLPNDLAHCLELILIEAFLGALSRIIALHIDETILGPQREPP
jgi:hypothetical protein